MDFWFGLKLFSPCCCSVTRGRGLAVQRSETRRLEIVNRSLTQSTPETLITPRSRPSLEPRHRGRLLFPHGPLLARLVDPNSALFSGAHLGAYK